MPENTRFLSDKERSLALKRLTLDAGESDEAEGGALHGLKLALLDVKVWVLTFLLTASVITVSFNAFFPSLVGTLGYNHILTLIITFGPWFWAFLCILANAFHSDRSRER